MTKDANTPEGDILRNYIRKSGVTQEEFAQKLSMTRQNLGYHMRKNKLDGDFKELLQKHGINIFSKMENNIIEEPRVEYITDTIPALHAEIARLNAIIDGKNEVIEAFKQSIERLAGLRKA